MKKNNLTYSGISRGLPTGQNLSVACRMFSNIMFSRLEYAYYTYNEYKYILAGGKSYLMKKNNMVVVN